MEGKRPERRCVACMQSFPKSELLRIVSKDGKPIADPTGKLPGRGCYICKNAKCAETAVKRNAFQRNLGVKMSKDEAAAFLEELKRYTDNE